MNAVATLFAIILGLKAIWNALVLIYLLLIRKMGKADQSVSMMMAIDVIILILVLITNVYCKEYLLGIKLSWLSIVSWITVISVMLLWQHSSSPND
jgi:glycerol-3-phosphate acyltransferase PlsY